ncbi:MAG: oligosaccharide flippase family protein [Bacteroidota bacterium]|nr:oligosaccharide flippase family protein [Bacteroidota bacterium]
MGIGKVQFVISFAQYFALLAAIGIPIYGIKETAKHRDDPEKLASVFTEISSIFFITSLLFSVIYCIIIFSFPFFTEERNLYLVAGILIVLSFSYTDWFYSGVEEFKAIALRSIFIKIISLILLYSFVKTETDFAKYLSIVVFSILGNQVLGFALVFNKTKLNFINLDFKRHLQPLIYIFSASIAASIYTVLDTVLLGFLSNEKAVGLYTASVKLVKITLPFVTSMGVILIPSISNQIANNKLEEAKILLKKSYDFLVFFSIPVAFGLAALAPEFIYIFSGKQFSTASVSMQVLAALPVLVGLGHFFSFQILVPFGKNKEIFYPMLAGVFSCLILNFLLVPILQEKGASIANVVTELIVTLLYFYFIRKFFTVNFNIRLVIQSLAAALFFFPIIMLIRSFVAETLYSFILSVFGCTSFYFLVQLFIFKNIFVLNFINTIRNSIRNK